MTIFDVIAGNITIWHVLDLVKVLILSTNLNGIFPINKEIAFAGIGHLMSLFQLIGKEGLPVIPFFDTGGKSMHQIGVFHIDLFWFGQLTHIVLIFVEIVNQCSLLKGLKDGRCLGNAQVMLGEKGAICERIDINRFTFLTVTDSISSTDLRSSSMMAETVCWMAA